MPRELAQGKCLFPTPNAAWENRSPNKLNTSNWPIILISRISLRRVYFFEDQAKPLPVRNAGSAASTRMNSGLVPQQPPTKVAPAFASSLAAPANSSGVVLYFAIPPTISGSPAFGFIQIGRLHAATRRLQIAMYSRAPTPQLAPMPCTPSHAKAVATCSGVAP